MNVMASGLRMHSSEMLASHEYLKHSSREAYSTVSSSHRWWWWRLRQPQFQCCRRRCCCCGCCSRCPGCFRFYMHLPNCSKLKKHTEAMKEAQCYDVVESCMLEFLVIQLIPQLFQFFVCCICHSTESEETQCHDVLDSFTPESLGIHPILLTARLV